MNTISLFHHALPHLRMSLGHWPRGLLLLVALLCLPLQRLQAQSSSRPASAPDRSPRGADTEPEEVLRAINNGWWLEARRLLDSRFLDPEQVERLDLQLLSAEVWFQMLDVQATLEALSRAERLAEGDQRENVARILKRLWSKIGTLEVVLEAPQPVRLEALTPTLDTQLQALAQGGADQLAQVGPRGTQVPVLEGGARLLRWFKLEGGGLEDRPSRFPAGVRLFLPPGSYRVNGMPVDLREGSTVRVTLTRPEGRPRPRMRLGLGWQSAFLQDSAGRLSQPSLNLQIGLGFRKLILELGAGMSLEPSSDDADWFGSRRPIGSLRLALPWKPLSWLQVQPGLTLEGRLLPYLSWSCEVGGEEGDSDALASLCLADGVSLGGRMGSGFQIAPFPNTPIYLHLFADAGIARLSPQRVEWLENNYAIRILETPRWVPTFSGGAGLGGAF